MADDGGLWTVAVGALVDIFVAESAKRKRWMRIISAIGSLLFIALIGGLIYITFKYS